MQLLNAVVNYYAAFSGSADIAKAATSVRRAIRLFNDRLALPTGLIQLHNLTTDTFKGLAKYPSASLITAGALFDIIRTSGALISSSSLPRYSGSVPMICGACSNR